MASCYSLILLALTVVGCASGQLSPGFYNRVCPQALPTISRMVAAAVRSEARMGASLLRLHFHDCFVNGCDASVLLDDNATFTGEKTARPNANSVRGFEVIDSIKTAVDRACRGSVVSCADILSVAARDSVVALGGPSWQVPLGRRDSTTASLSAANTQIPSPFANLSALISNFQSHGLNTRDLVALSGGHTIGLARCATFRRRIYNDTNIDQTFANQRRGSCPVSGGDNNLAPLDGTPTSFDARYFGDLIQRRGLLHSDQELFNGGSADGIVRQYARFPRVFGNDFVNSMVKMSTISPLIGTQGEIRVNYSRIPLALYTSVHYCLSLVVDMASPHSLCTIFLLTLAFIACASGQLSPGFYNGVCPQALPTIQRIVRDAVRNEARMGASLLRLHFHDCFVNGCDGSILLDDTSTFTGEKTSRANANSARGFEVIDSIKTAVDQACGGSVVSCADILAVAARDSVYALGGPSWPVPVGRRDSTTASLNDANTQIPSPSNDLSTLISNFQNKGLNLRDLVALSGGHTIGLAHCRTFRSRIYNDTNIDQTFASMRRGSCPASDGDDNLAPLDGTSTSFDACYFRDLMQRRGLLHSDQELFNGGSADDIVRQYASFPGAFWNDFANSMVKMGNISPLTGSQGEIRVNCRKLN
ncbi:hypothetical protein AMTRI_Chr08g209390 [Amborella trichopoda]